MTQQLVEESNSTSNSFTKHEEGGPIGTSSMSHDESSDNECKVRPAATYNGHPSNNLQLVRQGKEEEGEHHQLHQDQEQEVETSGSSVPEEVGEAAASHQPISPPPPLAAFATGASYGSSTASGRRRFSAARRRASMNGGGGGGGGSRSPPPPAAAACLPREENLYDSLVRYQADNDDSTTVSMGDTLRSVATWYSVQSDDDRKIPARPTQGTYEGTYREPIRRPYGRMGGSSNNSNSSGSAGAGAMGNSSSRNRNENIIRGKAGITGRNAAGNNISSSSSTGSNDTLGQANGNFYAGRPAAAAAAAAGPPPTAGLGGRYPPPAAATRRTSSGSCSMSRSVASGPPPVVWETDEKDNDDDHTAISSLANNTTDRMEEDQSILNSLHRCPLGEIDEGCAVISGGNDPILNNNNNNGSNNHKKIDDDDFACLTAAAQLAQETNMGNVVETTRSAPNPCADGTPPGRLEWNSMEWSFPNMVNNNNETAAAEARQPQLPPISSSRTPTQPMEHSPNLASAPAAASSATTRTTTAPAPAPPPIMNDFAKMQQTLGMEDLCIPGSTNHSTRSESVGSIRRDQSGRGGGGSGARQTSFGASSSVVSSLLSFGSTTSQGTQITTGGSINPLSSAAACMSSNNPTTSGPAAAVAPTASKSTDPAANEQYQIWEQIQQERERKQMELALQLSQTERAAATNVDRNNSSSAYPAQNAKSGSSVSGAAVSGTAGEGELDEEEALKVALRMSEEEAAGNGSGEGGEEEDEIALALRLSKEQAEADQQRFEQLQQETEQSEQEQLRLAMEQSMNQPSQPRRPMHHLGGASSLPTHDELEGDDEEMRRALAESLQRSNQCGSSRDNGENGDVDEDMALALRLSQVQMEQEEQFRRSFLQHPDTTGGGPQTEDPVVGSESYSQMMQPFGGTPPPLPVEGTTYRHGAAPELDDSMIAPPVRSRPSEEPASPGLGMMRGDCRRGSRGETPPEEKDVSGPTPGRMPSMEDLECLSSHVQETFEQQQWRGPHPAKKIHGPDDGSDMPPVSRPKRKDDKDDKRDVSRPCRSDINNVLDSDHMDRDSRDVVVREGQSETRAAIMQGQSQIVICRGCYGKLHAPLNCSLVFCPTCNTVSQVALGT